MRKKQIISSLPKMKQLIKVLVLIALTISFLLPGYVFFVLSPSNLEILLSDAELNIKLFTLFRLFGLYAFALVWLQVMLGTFRIPLTRLFGKNMLPIHISTGLFTFLFTYLHPLIFYTASFPLLPPEAMTSYLGPNILYGIYGVIAISCMTLAVIAGLLRNKPFITKYWRYIHYLNYGTFVFAFLHSFSIGSEVQFPQLRLLYYFFGITFIAGIWYKRGLPLLKSKIFSSTSTPTPTPRG